MGRHIVILMFSLIGAGMVVGFFMAPGAAKNIGAGIGWIAGTVLALVFIGTDRLRVMSAMLLWTCGVCLVLTIISFGAMAATYRGEFTSITGLLVLTGTVSVLLTVSFGVAGCLGHVQRIATPAESADEDRP